MRYFTILDIDCGDLPPFEHGAINFSEKRTTYGVQATYTCHENYTLIGNENRTCQIDGWTGKQPQCLVDWCPEPPPISGGKVQLSGKRAGSTATYECDIGHVLIGEPVGFVFCSFFNTQRNAHMSNLLINFRCLCIDFILWFGR